MPILFLDLETYYDSEYSLTKLAPPNYILDPRYETIGCAVRFEGEACSRFIDGPDLPAFLRSVDPARTTTVAFNALFDNCILAYRYNFVPARIVCTMRLAVALRGHLLQRHSLAEVGKSLGVGTKGDTLINARGKRRADLVGDPVLWRAYQAYACNDNDMSRAIFHQLMPEFPTSERRVMDRVMRCAIVPRFRVDTRMLEEHLYDLVEMQAELLIAAGACTTMDAEDRADRLEEFAKNMRSTAKFEAVLRSKGVEIQYKASTTDPERQIPAFAKTDKFMAELYDSDDIEVQALAAARLGVRSTIEQTRGNRMLGIAKLKWPRYCGGNMPMPLKYAAAHTHRLGGDWSVNVQNLPSGRGGKVSKLRKALMAPPGHKVVVADKSQIEARINAYICGEESLLQLFHDKADPYARTATLIFGYAVNKTDHPVERFIGKTAVLGLGYGCGPDRFYNMTITSARTLGVDLGDTWDLNMAHRAVRVYRMANPHIVRTWKFLDGVLATTWMTGSPEITKLGPVHIGKGYVEGPGDLKMQYANPRFDSEEQEFKFDYGGRTHKMYGAKFLENIVQFLARINTMHDALRISDRGYRFQLQSHDELVFIVPDAKVDECMRVVREEMCRAPSWAPDIPLEAEASFGQSYGDAK